MGKTNESGGSSIFPGIFPFILLSPDHKPLKGTAHVFTVFVASDKHTAGAS